VVGINQAIETLSGLNSGVGFAVPANTVRQIVPYLISEGKFVYPYLGVTCLSSEAMTLRTLDQLDLPQSTGAYVTSLVNAGPTDQAGLHADTGDVNNGRYTGDGDLIVAVDGREVRVFGDLLSYLVHFTRPGQTITLTIIRAGQTLDLAVVLGERP
jgi:2-alkenal reductase